MAKLAVLFLLAVSAVTTGVVTRKRGRGWLSPIVSVLHVFHL